MLRVRPVPPRGLEDVLAQVGALDADLDGPSLCQFNPVDGGVLFNGGMDRYLRAFDQNNGKVLWQTSGTPSTAGVMGVSVPAIQGNTVVFPFASGQLLAADRERERRQRGARVEAG